jgi:hypothetical protein
MSGTRPLIVGLNKYSHDAACCVIEASTGRIVFSQSKERISRRKHDGGSTGSILRYALESISASVEDVAVVVANNHHFRIKPYERRAPFAAALGYIPADVLEHENLVSGTLQLELSHHLAHAYSVASTCPFEEGLILCMDGMGESYRSMAEDLAEGVGDSYLSDLRLLRSLRDEDIELFSGVPRNLIPGAGYREAESAYLLKRSGVGEARRLVPVFKRWCRERSPPELYNHGFENMDSLGILSIVFVR